MKKWMNWIYWTWGLPQTILGSIFYWKFKKDIIEIKEYKLAQIIKIKNDGFGGLCLGKNIFLDENTYAKEDIAHEYGHTLQSLILGPFYMLIIVLPSQINYVITKRKMMLDRKNYANIRKDYFKRFPENWADKLGKVKR